MFYAVSAYFVRRGSQARAESAKLLVERLNEQFADHPVVLTGDFNTMPDSAPYQTLTTGTEERPAFRDAHSNSAKQPSGPSSTWNGFTKIVPNRRIDYIFVNDQCEVLTHRILDDQREGKFPSDHLPVVTKLRTTRGER